MLYQQTQKHTFFLSNYKRHGDVRINRGESTVIVLARILVEGKTCKDNLKTDWVIFEV